MKKLILTGLIALILGTSAGFYVGKTYGFYDLARSSKKYQQELDTYLLYGEILIAHTEQAYKAYRQEKPEIAIWALERLIIEHQKLSASTGENAIISAEDINFELALTYARLSKLYSRVDDQNNVNKSNEKSLFYGRSAGRYSSKFQDIGSTLEFVKELDQRLPISQK